MVAKLSSGREWLVSVLVCVLLMTTASAQEEQERNTAKFFIKSYSTTTETAVSAFTTVVPYQCFLTSVTDPCVGRRLRRSRRMSMDVEDILTGSTDLDSSHGTPKMSEDESSNKFFFTIQRSVTTTVTITTTSTNMSITVSASAYCIYAGFTGPLC